MISATRRGLGESRISEPASITITTFALSHGTPPISIHLPTYLCLFGNIPTNNYSPDGTAQSCSATWSRLLWSILERACIGAWNASGMISIIQMNVHIELDDHKHHPPLLRRLTGGGAISSKLHQRHILRDISRILSRSSMNTAMRIFARLTESLISWVGLLKRQGERDGRELSILIARGYVFGAKDFNPITDEW